MVLWRELQGGEETGLPVRRRKDRKPEEATEQAGEGRTVRVGFLQGKAHAGAGLDQDSEALGNAVSWEKSATWFPEC